MDSSRIQKVHTVDAYISSQPKELQAKLEQLRQTIRKSAPKAEEGIGYGMPSYKWQGPLVYFACFKNHFGFFPMPAAIAAFKEKLSAYELAKGTVRFPHNVPLPVKLIADIVKFRVRQNEEKAALKQMAKTKKAIG